MPAAWARTVCGTDGLLLCEHAPGWHCTESASLRHPAAGRNVPRIVVTAPDPEPSLFDAYLRPLCRSFPGAAVNVAVAGDRL